MCQQKAPSLAPLPRPFYSISITTSSVLPFSPSTIHAGSGNYRSLTDTTSPAAPPSAWRLPPHDSAETRCSSRQPPLPSDDRERKQDEKAADRTKYEDSRSSDKQYDFWFLYYNKRK
jgi:hypothetical protein